MKLSVIGGGGVRSPLLAKSIAQRAKKLGITELVFMDIDEEKLRIYGGLSAELSRRLNPKLAFSMTKDPVEAVRDADYLITAIRVGGDSLRVQDERIALSLGVLGQETTGAAGFSFSMRSVPALAEYCELARRYAKPSIKVFNFTNPAGLVSQTLRDMGYDFTYGICDAPIGMLSQFAALYGVRPEELEGECYGLNHLSFFPSIRLHKKELLKELLMREDALEKTDLRYFEKDLLLHMGLGLNEYLYYFYYREKALSNILNAPSTRGERIEEINRRMTEELSGMDVKSDFEACLRCFERFYGERENAYMEGETGIHRDSSPALSSGGDGYAGVALHFLEILKSGKAGTMILSVPNRGAIPGLKDDDVVEISCEITESSVRPHRFPEVDERALELIRRVKSYERFASRALRRRSIKDTVDCLMLHPLVNSYSLAKELCEKYLELNAPYCGGWS